MWETSSAFTDGEFASVYRTCFQTRCAAVPPETQRCMSRSFVLLSNWVESWLVCPSSIPPKKCSGKRDNQHTIDRYIGRIIIWVWWVTTVNGVSSLWGRGEVGCPQEHRASVIVTVGVLPRGWTVRRLSCVGFVSHLYATSYPGRHWQQLRPSVKSPPIIPALEKGQVTRVKRRDPLTRRFAVQKYVQKAEEAKCGLSPDQEESFISCLCWEWTRQW